MKLSNVLKVFGAAAVIAGLTPYRVTSDEKTGETKVRALFWEVTSGNSEDEGKSVSVNVGFFSPLAKDDDEAHLFADELTVEYSKKAEEEEPAVSDESESEDEAVEEPDEAVEEATTDEAAPEESAEEPVEEAEAAEAAAEAEETKEPEESAEEN